MMFLYLKKNCSIMKIVIIGVIIIAIAIAVGALTLNDSDTGSEGTGGFFNESSQSFEEELTPEGNRYKITLEETVGMELNP